MAFFLMFFCFFLYFFLDLTARIIISIFIWLSLKLSLLFFIFPSTSTSTSTFTFIFIICCFLINDPSSASLILSFLSRIFNILKDANILILAYQLIT